MKPYLPQNDPEPQQRRNYLSHQQQAYRFDYDFLSPLVFLQEVPAVENFSAKYIAERVLATAEILPNMLAAKGRDFLDPFDELQDYEDLFTVLPLPKVAKVYQTNSSFAEQRLSGANPMVIRLLQANDPRAEVLKKIPSYKKEFEPLFDVPKELANGNIYIADYTGTDANYRGPALVQGGTHEKGRKYLPKPRAFFWWRQTGIRDRGKLVPIAIQLEIAPDSHVYTPFDRPLDWLFAKFCVQIADGNHHEMNSHLGRTHVVMEPIAIGTAHHLAENHPLSLLLRPHFRFMLTNNHLAQEHLINPGGDVDELLAGTLAESLELAKDAYEGWNLRDFAFPTEIKNRGLDDPDRLPHYPYRDDGLLLWNAIYTFVFGYLNYFYPTTQAIVDDSELQAWARELSSPKEANGGKVKGMPDRIDTVTQLVEIVTAIVFTCGPQHSAVNFPQYEYMAFAPNMPLAAYRNMPEPHELITEKEILQLLPPYKRTADQLKTLYSLAAYRYDRLGNYDKSFQELYHEDYRDIFAGTPILDLLRQFQQDLNAAEQEIDADNQKRIVPYPFLKPSLVLNSISI
ncbi:lipoxygenase family protein [Tumidithrix elongata]